MIYLLSSTNICYSAYCVMHRKYKEIYDPRLQGTYPSWVDRAYEENKGILNPIKCQVSITVLK